MTLAGPVLRRLNSVHANHKRIASSALLIGALTLLAKVFVAGREVAIAWRYGVSATVDAYQLAFTIVTWLPMLLISVMSVVLVPQLVRLGRNDKGRAAFVSEANGTILLVGAGIALLTFVAAPLVAGFMASRLGSATVGLTNILVQRMAPVALFMIAAGYLTARLQARERFGYTATEAVPAFLIALLVVGPFGLPGVLPLILGTVVGYLGQLLVLSWLTGRGDPPLGGLSIRHRSEEWRTVYGSVLFMALGQLIIAVTVPIDQWFAARIGEGAVATLGYANRIVILFFSLGSVVIGRALLPVFSAAVANGEVALGRRHALQWSGLMFGAALLGTLILWVAAPELVRLLFERGAFDAAASARVANVLRFALLQLPFVLGAIALVQWTAATGGFKTILWITVAGLAAKLLLNAILVPRFYLPGLMISTGMMYFTTSALLLLTVYRGTGSAIQVQEQRATE